MKRLSVLCLLFLGLLAMANAEKFRTLSLNKGIAQIPRSLTVQDTTPSNVTSLIGLSNVATDFGMDYLVSRDKNYTTLPPDQTRMTIMISLNETIFTEGDGRFTTYYCEADANCAEVENSSLTVQFPILLPFYTVDNATRLNFTLNQSTSAATIVNGSWQLNTQPLLVKDARTGNSSETYYDDFPSSANLYAFGMIGLGTEGDAAQNFLTPNPIFSFHINASESTGDLIFGFDETRISSYTPAYNTLKTDENWRMNLSSIQYGDYTYNDTMTLVFDVSVNDLHVPWKVHDDIRTAWNDQFGSKLYSCNPGSYSSRCYFYTNNLTMIPNITFTLADGTQFSIDAYHFFHGSSDDFVPEDPTDTKSWTEDLAYIGSNYSTNGSNSSYVVFGQRAMSQFYTLFEKTTTGNTITLYNPVPQIEGGNYTAPEKPVDNGNGNGNNNNGTTPDAGTGTGEDSGDSDAWITYLTYAGVAAVVIIFIVVIACCCCKSEPKPVAKKTLTVELRGADKSTESSVASSVRL